MPGLQVTNGSANSRKPAVVNGNGSAASSNKLASKPSPKPAAGSAPPSPSASTSATLAAPEAQHLLQAIFTAPSAPECAQAASQLCEHVNANSLRVLHEQGIITSLVAAASNKKSGYERESAAVAVEALAYKCGGKNATPFALGADPWLLDAFLLPLLELYADKGDVVREAAEKAATALLSLAPQESAPDVLQRLFKVLQDGSVKWQTKIGALKLISRLSESASEQIGELLEDLIPVLTTSMHETKAEVS
jgi:elongation factor 3